MGGTSRLFLALGAGNAAVAVALGAFAAHGLKTRLAPELLQAFQTGVQYHFYHALGLLAVGLVAVRIPDSALLKGSGWLMIGGIALFSVSLYALSLTGLRALGAITPFGGAAFIAAWLLLAVAVLQT